MPITEEQLKSMFDFAPGVLSFISLKETPRGVEFRNCVSGPLRDYVESEISKELDGLGYNLSHFTQDKRLMVFISKQNIWRVTWEVDIDNFKGDLLTSKKYNEDFNEESEALEFKNKLLECAKLLKLRVNPNVKFV